MTKRNTLLLSLAILGFTAANAQNVGIGTATPLAKTHVVQIAAVDGILVEHSGTAGSSTVLFPTNATNPDATLFIANGTVGIGIDNIMLTPTSTASSIASSNLGLGLGLDIWQANTGASGAGLQIFQDGTGALSRGSDIYMDAANVAIGYSLFHSGLGRGSYYSLSNTANTSTGLDLRHAGRGRGLYMDLSNTANTNIGSTLFHSGTGGGQYTELINTANNSTGSFLIHRGTGTGRGLEVYMTGLTGTGIGVGLFHSGLGRGGNVSLTNTANTDLGWAVFHSGTGTGVNKAIAIYGQTPGDAIYGVSTGSDGDAVIGVATGIAGTGGVFQNTNAAANRNSLGVFVYYAGTSTTGGGGGNAAEFRHDGTNGTGVDIFMGDPSAAPGPANTTSDYAALSISQMATGASATAGASKSAISANNNSADPAALFFNNGTDDGDGMQVFTTPNASALTTGIYTQSDNISPVFPYPSLGLGNGVGLWATGGNYGVIGDVTGGSNLGLLSTADFAAFGAKAFMIDYPLDPTNKTLRHYCIESNEILNMYRGVIQLDGSGQAVVELPEYFDAININVTYQLTPIGTGVQPYIAVEEANNQFTIAGAPNTKVSWTVHAQRNDPTIQYFNERGGNYSSNVQMKKDHEIGKYFTPEAYGKDKTQGIFYDVAKDKNYSERELFTKQEKLEHLNITEKSASLPSNTENAKEDNETVLQVKNEKTIESKINR